MPNYAVTVTKRKNRRKALKEDLYYRYEIYAGAAGWRGEVFVPKGNTQPASADTMTITVTQTTAP